MFCHSFNIYLAHVGKAPCKTFKGVSNESDTNLDFKELAVLYEKQDMLAQCLFTEELPCVRPCAGLQRHSNEWLLSRSSRENTEYQLLHVLLF